MKWIVFFSQTGTEIVDLVSRLGRKPDLVVFNGKDVPDKIRDLNIEIKCLPGKPSTEDYFSVFPNEDFIATFHGWLRIVPPEVCKAFNSKLFNGHPGLITKFPELKGKDPQIRAFQGMYTQIGSVVHELTAELDGGDILTQESTLVEYPTSLDFIFSSLRETSLKAWLAFFKNRI